MLGIFMLLLVGGLAALHFLGWSWPLPGLMPEVWEGCIWEPDYCWASCVEIEPMRGNYDSPHQCPTGADVIGCRVRHLSFSTGISEAHVYQSCAQDGWFGEWTCQGFVRKTYEGDTIKRGQWIVSNLPGGGGVNMDLDIRRKVLMSCGTAACTGGGEPIVGAQGCSWNPGDHGYTWDDGTTGARSVSSVGTGFRYVCSQHLVSCPSFCDDPMLCSTPSNLKTVTVTYNGQQHPATCRRVGSTAQLDIYGCKPESTCIRSDPATGACLEYGDKTVDGRVIGQCGVVAVQNAGECCQNSDCGSIGTYYCDWDSANNRGTCEPIEDDTEIECRYDYDCSQTGTGCRDRKLYSVECVNNKCVFESEDVGCCSILDCPSGYFCNFDYECQLSQEEERECPFECCDQEYNPEDYYYKHRPCPSAAPVCCPDHSCALTLEDCAGGGGGGGDEGDWNWIWIIILAALGAAIGYALGDLIGAAIGGILGGIAGFAVYWFLSLAWWQQWLLGIGGIAGGGIMIYLFGGAVAGFILLLVVALRK